MKINRFETALGRCVEDIAGQYHIGYSMSDLTDFYEMDEYLKNGGYQGSTISFYDYDTGKIYEPFQKQRNVLYGKPVYLKDCFWFLQGDYDNGKITLFMYVPDKEPEIITQLDLADADRYNLQIIGEDIHIISDDENDCETDEYKYYEEVVVRDFNGNVLSAEVGCLQQHSDGTWWIA